MGRARDRRRGISVKFMASVVRGVGLLSFITEDFTEDIYLISSASLNNLRTNASIAGNLAETSCDFVFVYRKNIIAFDFSRHTLIELLAIGNL